MNAGAIARWHEAQRRLLSETYDSAWHTGVSSYEPDEDPDTEAEEAEEDPETSAEQESEGLGEPPGPSLVQARERNYHAPVVPDESAKAEALGGASNSLNTMAAQMLALAPSDDSVDLATSLARSGDILPDEIGQHAEALALDDFMNTNAWRMDAGDSVAWAGEQDGYAQAANADGQLLEWLPEADDRVCSDCEGLGDLPPMPLSDFPTTPGSGDTICNAGCRCVLQVADDQTLGPNGEPPELNQAQEQLVSTIAERREPSDWIAALPAPPPMSRAMPGPVEHVGPPVKVPTSVGEIHNAGDATRYIQDTLGYGPPKETIGYEGIRTHSGTAIHWGEKMSDGSPESTTALRETAAALRDTRAMLGDESTQLTGIWSESEAAKAGLPYSPMDPREFAHVVYQGNETQLVLNDAVDKLTAIIGTTTRDTGFNAPATRDLYGRVLHEMGHNYMDRSPGSDRAMSGLMYRTKLGPGVKELRQYISQYSLQNDHEGFAEIFATLMRPGGLDEKIVRGSDAEALKLDGELKAALRSFRDELNAYGAKRPSGWGKLTDPGSQLQMDAEREAKREARGEQYLGITPYRPEFANSPEFYGTQRFRQFEADLRRVAEEEGVTVDAIDHVRGVWKGGGEPAARVKLTDGVNAVRHVADQLGGAYEQDGVIRWRTRDAGSSVRYISRERVDANELEKAMEHADLPGATLLPDGRLEVIDIGNANPAAVRKLGNDLGVRFGYHRGDAEIREAGEQYKRGAALKAPRPADGTGRSRPPGTGPERARDDRALAEEVARPAGREDAHAVVEGLARGEHISVTPDRVLEIVHGAADLGKPVNLEHLHVAGDSTLFDFHATDLSRVQMPQIGDSTEVQAFAKELRDRGVSSSQETVSPLDLHATQDEIDPVKVDQIYRWITGEPQAAASQTLVVAKDGAVLDGHHRWAGESLYAIDHPNYRVQVLRVNEDIHDLLRDGARFDREHHIEPQAFGAKAPGNQVGVDRAAEGPLAAKVGVAERKALERLAPSSPPELVAKIGHPASEHDSRAYAKTAEVEGFSRGSLGHARRMIELARRDGHDSMLLGRPGARSVVSFADPDNVSLVQKAVEFQGNLESQEEGQGG